MVSNLNCFTFLCMSHPNPLQESVAYSQKSFRTVNAIFVFPLPCIPNQYIRDLVFIIQRC